MGTADFEGTTGNIAVEQLKAYFENLAWYCSSHNYLAIYFCVCRLYWLVEVHNRCFGLADSHYIEHYDCFWSDFVREED